jgi:hypothetical protein
MLCTGIKRRGERKISGISFVYLPNKKIHPFFFRRFFDVKKEVNGAKHLIQGVPKITVSKIKPIKRSELSSTADS